MWVPLCQALCCQSHYSEGPAARSPSHTSLCPVPCQVLLTQGRRKWTPSGPQLCAGINTYIAGLSVHREKCAKCLVWRSAWCTVSVNDTVVTKSEDTPERPQ